LSYHGSSLPSSSSGKYIMYTHSILHLRLLQIGSNGSD